MERFSYLCNEFDTDMMTLTIKATDMIILTKDTTKMKKKSDAPTVTSWNVPTSV